MAGYIVEKKVRYVGSWSEKTVNDNVIKQINNKIRNETGHKVKLQLWSDGMRVHKTSLIQGKMLHEFIPFPTIHFLTVSQNTPDFLVVIAKSRDPNYQYQLFAFRCANAMDASMFIEGFRSITRSIEPGHGFNPATKKTHDGINWTLRENEKRNDAKRELNQLVNIHGDSRVVQSNGGVRVMVNQNQAIQNGQASPNEYKVHMYRKGKPPQVQRSHEFEMRNGDISDSHSEVSESALRLELESLSQELKDIKYLIEKSTGLTTAETKVRREFEPLEIKVHKTTVSQDDVYKVESPKTPNVLAALDAVVQEEDDREAAKAYIRRSEEDQNVIRVTVPDYRTPAERISTTVTSKSVEHDGPIRIVAKRGETSGYGSISSRTSTMSYDNWKRQNMGNDMSERIQWRARSNTTPRPRTTIPSFSSDVTDSSQYVRHHTTHLVPAYQRVSFDPRVHERKTKSLRMRGVSTTVAKPIEKVYVRDSGRHSLVLRPHSGNVRPALIMQNEPVPNGIVHHGLTEQNNNVVKVENSDTDLLDVSGIDLYKETPTLHTTSQQAVIRT